MSETIVFGAVETTAELAVVIEYIDLNYRADVNDPDFSQLGSPVLYAVTRTTDFAFERDPTSPQSDTTFHLEIQVVDQTPTTVSRGLTLGTIDLPNTNGSTS